MYKAYYRAYQKTLKIASTFLNWRKPELLEGENSLLQLPAVIKQKAVNKVLIVTDQGITQLGLMQPLIDQLISEQIGYVVYDETVPNPTISNIEQAYAIYKELNFRTQKCLDIA